MRPMTRPAGSSWTKTLPMRKRESWMVSAGSSERRMRRMESFVRCSLRALTDESAEGEDMRGQFSRREFFRNRREKADRDIRGAGERSWRRKDRGELRADDGSARNPARHT